MGNLLGISKEACHMGMLIPFDVEFKFQILIRILGMNRSAKRHLTNQNIALIYILMILLTFSSYDTIYTFHINTKLTKITRKSISRMKRKKKITEKNEH